MVIQFILLVSVFLWAGCLIAISFMESWLKFRAPGVTLPIGLGIGKLVFNALNKMEWLFAIIMLAGTFVNKQEMQASVFWFGAAFLVLVLQTFWLLPALDTRANAVIKGAPLASSSVHWYFVIAETIKLIALFVWGFKLFEAIIAG